MSEYTENGMKLDFAPLAQPFAYFAVSSFFNRKGRKEKEKYPLNFDFSSCALKNKGFLSVQKTSCTEVVQF